MEETVFKIRNQAGQFSHGVINKQRHTGKWFINWSNHGKQWKTEKAVKAHLAKALKLVSGVASWEIIQVTYSSTKPIEDWVDDKMLVDILKLP